MKYTKNNFLKSCLININIKTYFLISFIIFIRLVLSGTILVSQTPKSAN